MTLVCKVFSAIIDEGAIIYFQQQSHGSATFFVDLPVRFSQGYMQHIQEPKRTDNLFEINKHTQESFKHFVDWFEVVCKLIINLDQFMAYITFISGFMHYPNMNNHPLLSNLVIICIEKTQLHSKIYLVS